MNGDPFPDTGPWWPLEITFQPGLSPYVDALRGRTEQEVLFRAVWMWPGATHIKITGTLPVWTGELT